MAVTPVDFDEPVGAIGIYWAKHHRPGKDEMTLLQSLAGLADLALANARSYEETLRARSQAEHANRLKDEFLATVSHELRSRSTPCSVGPACCEIPGSYPTSSVKTRSIIERNSKALSRLVEDLLDVSRIISGKLRLDVRPLNLSEVLDQTIENIRTAAEAKRIKIKVTNDFPKAIVVADAERIQQIVFNLLSNAIKFTDEGGRVDIFVKQVDSSYEIEVKDTGRGISADFLPYVFDRFRQAERLTVGPPSRSRARLSDRKKPGRGTRRPDPGRIRRRGLGSAFTIAMPGGRTAAGHSGNRPAGTSAGLGPEP
jgi:signal transduction histidine kinase